MVKGFLNKAADNAWTWATGILLMLLSLSLNLFFPENYSAFNEIKPGVNFLLDWTNYSAWLVLILQNHYFRIILQALSLVGVTIIVQYIATNHKIIRVRSFFPFFFVCLFAAAFIPKIGSSGPFIATLFFCWSVYLLFYVEDKDNSGSIVFDSAFLLAVSSLFLHRIVYLLLLFWIILSILQAFSIRNFFASLIGFLSVFWILAGVSALVGNFLFLESFASDITNISLIDIANLGVAGQMFCGLQIIMTLITSVSFLASQHLDKLHTRNIIYSVLLMLLFLFAICIISESLFSGYLFLFLAVESLMLAYYFSLNSSVLSKILFGLNIVLSVIFFFRY